MICEPNPEIVKEKLYERMPSYYPEFHGLRYIIEQVPFLEKSTYPLYLFKVRDISNVIHRSIVVKFAPVYNDNNEGKTEYKNLTYAYERFEALGEDIHVAKPLDFFDDINALVVEKVEGERFGSKILRMNSKFASKREKEKLFRLIVQSGRWLYSYHQFTQAKIYCTLNEKFVIELKKEMVALETYGFPHKVTEKVLGVIYEIFSTMILHKFPLVNQHGDFGPQNIMISQNGMYVFDLQRSQYEIIYSDVAYFLVSLETINPLPKYPLYDFKYSMVLQKAFMLGYFGAENGNLNDFEQLVLSVYYLKELIYRCAKQRNNIARKRSRLILSFFDLLKTRGYYPNRVMQLIDKITYKKSTLINICHVVLSLEFGGLEKVAIALADGVDKRKYRVIICCLDRLGDFAREAESRGITVILVGRKPGIDMSLPFRLSRIFKDEKIDIVHSHNFAPMLYGTIGAKMAKVRLILNTIHGREKKIKHNYIWSKICGFNDYVVTISQDARNEFLKYAKIKPDRVKVIHNGVDVFNIITTTDNKAMKEKLGILSSDFVVGTVSRLSGEKDQFTLLKAFKEVANNLSNVRLVIAGDGKLKRELESYSAQLGISDKVLFLGFRNDIGDILPVFDVFVLTSLTEGISISLLEAMAASKPVVATRVGGNLEIIKDGETGYLVPPKNSREIANAIMLLLRDRDLSGRIGSEARNKVENYFSLNKMVSEYETFYENA